MLLLALLPLFSPAGPAPQGELVRLERSLTAMGTRLSIELQAPSRALALEASEAALAALEAVEARLSTWREGSELSLLNRSEPHTAFDLSPSLAAELERAFSWSQATGGAFDPTVGALVDAWDLRGAGRRPGPDELSTALESTGEKAFELDLPQRLTRRSAAARIEEAGWGKGAGLDAALASLRATGIADARLDLGGQTAVLCADSRKTFAVAHPRDREHGVVAIDLHSGSIATSGNSERGLWVEGELVGHVLDPRSGRPAADFGSVTVWSESAFDADCLSTALFVLGPEKALEFATGCDSIEALVLCPEGNELRLRATSGLRGRLHTLVPNLQIEWVPGPVQSVSPSERPSDR